MKKIAIILSILSTILLSQLSAVDDLQIVAQDDFPAAANCPNELVCKGWTNGTSGVIRTVSTAGSYSLEIERNENATKTFFFPTLKIGQNVTVKFVFGRSSNSASAYTLNTKLNNETHTFSFSGLSGAVSSSTSSNSYFKEITYDAKLDVDKKLKIDFAVSGGSGTYKGYVKSVTIIANGVVWIDDAQIEQNTASDVYMQFAVHNPSGIAAEIDYKTVPLNAQEGVDYEAANGTLEFNSGETEKNIAVKILQHSAPLSEDKRFAVSIESGDVRITDAEAIGTIKAQQGAISIEDAGFIYAGNNSANPITANFTLHNSYSVPVSVDYHTEDITAQAGTHYIAKSGTVTFAANEKTKIITVTVIGNLTADQLAFSKEFKVVLTGAHLTKESATAILYGLSNTQNSTGTNNCGSIDSVTFLDNHPFPTAGVIKGSMTTSGKANSESNTDRKGRFFEFTAGMDARVEITIKATGSRTLDFIQSTKISPCSSNNNPNGAFFEFSRDGGSTMYYVLKADQKFRFSNTLPANSLISWWMNPEGQITNEQLDPRKIEHSVMHVKAGQKGYFFVGAYNSANTQVTTDYEIEIKYLPKVTVIQELANNGISDYEIVNPLSTRNLYGNIKSIGNSFLCITDYGDGTGGFNNLVNAGLLTKASGEVCTKSFTETANYQQMPYLDMDSDSSTYNSAMARLSTPADSKVVWAGLFWIGMVDRNSPYWFVRHQAPYRSYTDENHYASNSFDVEKILLKVPGSANYQEVYAQKLIYVNGYGAAMFGAYKDITDMINPEAADGEYWAANFRGSAGLNEIGNYGGWSMVVIYEENPENPDIEGVFRNLSVFNGFGKVDEPQSFYIGGFLTPKNGDVDAFLHIFAGEGELGLAGDNIRITPSKKGSDNYVRDNSKYPANFIATHPSTLSDAEKKALIGKPLSHMDSSGNFRNSNENILTGTIGKADRYPITRNGNGIDLKSIDIGEHIKNQNDNITVILNDGNDHFYPSMVATSIQLYDPDICYEENVTYNGLPIQAGNLPPKNGIVEYTLIIKHKEHEDAEKVTIHKTFIEDYGLEYVTSSMRVKNSFDSPSVFSDKTDAIGDDTAQYSNSAIRINVGRGASATQGGTLRTLGNVSDMVEFKYKAKLTTNNTIKENVYLIDYDNAYLSLEFKNRPIKKCYDFSNTFEPGQPPIGTYRAVNEKFSKNTGDIISNDALHSDNALYTQVAGKSFDVKLLFTNSSSNTIEDPTLGGAYEKLIEIELIKYPEYLVSDTIAEKQVKCESAASLVNFGEKNITSGVTNIDNITINDAYREVTFRVKDMETNATACSPDRFAMRPAQFNIDGLVGQLIGGADNHANLIAVTTNGTVTASYDQYTNTISLGNTTLEIPGLCDPADIDSVIDAIDFKLTHGDFISGIADMTAKYNNVGKVITGFVDNDWTSKDIVGTKEDCNKNSTSNVHDADGKVGCDIATAGKIITFIPKDFFADVTISGADGGDFVYLSNDGNMAGEVITKLTARLADDTTATNYHQNCFANNVAYTIRLVNGAPAGWGGRDGSTKERAIFFEESNVRLDNNNTGGDGIGDFTVEQNHFNSGEVSDVRFNFNFGRSVNKPEEPFIINVGTDFEIKNDDITDIDVKEADVHIEDKNIKFFYGRAFVDNYEGKSPIAGEVWYEVYCDACVMADYGINLAADMDKKSTRWFVNRGHNSATVGIIPAGSYTPNVVGNIAITPTGVPAAGIESVTFTNNSGQTPYQDMVHAVPSPWLIYNPINAAAGDISFTVKFIGDTGGWAGEGGVKAGDSIGGVIPATPVERTKMKADW
ncbi:MAG: hypothetical protein LBS26_03100 [Campylobacteraceae bacterium]|jgi:hypothetical protein|nr:hypothetical protein [Campylobacteraceae bacterium]